MRNYSFFLLVLLFCFIVRSQELKNKFGENYYTRGLYQKEYKEAKGSPYLNEEFKPAKINNIEEIILVRFDALNDQVEIMAKNNSFMILDNSRPYTISVLDGSKKRYKTKSYLHDKGENKTSFFEIIYENDEFELYKKERIRFYKEKEAQPYQESQPANFKKDPNTYYINNFAGKNNILIQLSNKTNRFIEIFPEGSAEMKRYIKEEKLDLDQTDDLIHIFRYYFENL